MVATQKQAEPVNLLDALSLGSTPLFMCLFALSDPELALLAATVPERGQELWQRYQTWRQARSQKLFFCDWLKSLPQPAPPSPPPPPLPDEPTASLDHVDRRECTKYLRCSSDQEAAKRGIVKYLKRSLVPHPNTVECRINWSRKPYLRTATIVPEGYATYTIDRVR